METAGQGSSLCLWISNKITSKLTSQTTVLQEKASVFWVRVVGIPALGALVLGSN